MPGFVIHLAVAQEYLKKHNRKYSLEFMRGTVAPDFTTDKSKTHYGKSPAYTNINGFLKDNKLDTDYNQGFFLHLVTDYLFYNKYLERREKAVLHNDYDLTNKELIEKYDVTLIEEVKEIVQHKEGTPEILTHELVCKVIDEVSDLDLNEVAEEAKREDVKWNTYKK